MARVTKYFSLQGKVHFGKRLPNGNLGVLTWAENCPKLDLTIETEKDTIKESFSGQKLDDFIFDKGTTIKLAMSLYGFSLDNVARAFYSAIQKQIAGTVTNELLPELLAGEYFRVNKPNTSNWVLTDSTAGTPVSLVDGQHYRIDSAFGGIGEMVSTQGLVQPIKAAYSYGAANLAPLFTKPSEEVWVVFAGINTADRAPALLDLYRTNFSPAGSLPVINNEGVGTIDLDGSVLNDSAKVQDPLLGGYGRLILGGAP